MTKILGLGGAGLNMLNSVIDLGFEPEHTIYIDTSRNAVWASKTENFLEIGASLFNGLGTGRNQTGGRAAAELAESEIIKALKGADTVVILSCLSGGTGGGSISFIAKLAIEYIGAKTIAVVTNPSEIECKNSKALAKQALANLEIAIDKESLSVLPTAKGTLATMFNDTDKQVAQKVKKLLGESFFQRRKRVFLGGSESITELTENEKSVIDEYIANDYQILVGDCHGADTEIQKHLAERRYKSVKLYATDAEARSNVGNFKVIDCPSMRTARGRNIKDYSYYKVKDYRMLTLCDEVVMFWDGIDSASRENLEEGASMKKTAKAVLRPFETKIINNDSSFFNDT